MAGVGQFQPLIIRRQATCLISVVWSYFPPLIVWDWTIAKQTYDSGAKTQRYLTGKQHDNGHCLAWSGKEALTGRICFIGVSPHVQLPETAKESAVPSQSWQRASSTREAKRFLRPLRCDMCCASWQYGNG